MLMTVNFWFGNFKPVNHESNLITLSTSIHHCHLTIHLCHLSTYHLHLQPLRTRKRIVSAQRACAPSSRAHAQQHHNTSTMWEVALTSSNEDQVVHLWEVCSFSFSYSYFYSHFPYHLNSSCATDTTIN